MKMQIPFLKRRSLSSEYESPNYDIRTTVDFPHGRLFHATSDRNEEDDESDYFRGFGAMIEKPFDQFGKARVEFSEARKSIMLKYHFKIKIHNFKTSTAFLLI